MCNKLLRVHSIESFGAADGPGVRFVVFLQGCKMRCIYCHNPDTWNLSGGTEMSAEELIERALRYKSYWKNDGGITVSGGEPLLQIESLTEFLKLAKCNGIHTTIDTSGNPFSFEESFIQKFNELMKYTDLVMLDLKHIDTDKHEKITGFKNKNILDMAKYLSDIGKSMWIRHVLVPNYTDSNDDLLKLQKFISSLKTIEKIEVLPYHTLGMFKWENLGIEYKLNGINSPTHEEVENAIRILNNKTKSQSN